MTLYGPEAYHALHGIDSVYTKAAYYDVLHPMISLDSVRDPKVHAHRRRVWDRAFNIKGKASSFRSIKTDCERLLTFYYIALERAESVIYEEANGLVEQLLRHRKRIP